MNPLMQFKQNRFWNKAIWSCRCSLLLCVIASALASMNHARADTVVSDGKFTNVYVYPDPDKETWEQHLNNLPPDKKPKDWQKFTIQAIDAFTEALMSADWPSYFGALHQYGGINPPHFFGSYAISQECWEAAKKDLHNGVVLEWTTASALANCHKNGRDPSPQVNLIFSPDIQVGEFMLPTADGPDICSQTGSHTVAYHAGGLNRPNFAALPTAPGCAPDFATFTQSLSHEDVEILSDPGGFGHGSAIFGSENELADQCNQPMTWKGFSVVRYRSDNDNDCWPPNFPDHTTTTIWVLAQNSPIIRFTGDRHEVTLNVPAQRLVNDAAASEVQVWIQTGSDNLRGGNDNADATLIFADGTTFSTPNINASREWGNGQTHVARLALPPAGVRVRDIQGVTIATRFGGGVSGDNWNVDKVALMVAFPEGSPTSSSQPSSTVVDTWLDKSGGPLVRFSGSEHERSWPVEKQAPPAMTVTSLELIISTGNDDLRGGSNPKDNCDVTVGLKDGFTCPDGQSIPEITLKNVNNGAKWSNWTDHTVSIPLPSCGLRGADVKSVTLHTGFGGGLGGDNWNVQRIQLRATLTWRQTRPPRDILHP
jgi:hypothetical protein